MKRTFVFDTEIIGSEKPFFFVGAKDIETQEIFKFRDNKKSTRQDFTDLLLDPNNTWVSFNGMRFDDPLITMWLYGYDSKMIKMMATRIIKDRMMPWDVRRATQVDQLVYDHIDIMEVAPGVMTSLKIYAGRMFFPSIIDLPVHHDKDLTPKEKKLVEHYCCHGDLGVTEWLYRRILSEIALREELGAQHGMDLRSKSDAQVAEAILKKAVGITRSPKNSPPLFVEYTAPDLVKTTNPVLQTLIGKIEKERFAINQKNGSLELPAWLENVPIALGDGIYQCGVGGLHSKHDKQFYAEASDDFLISDFDVASYYPSIILNAGFIPEFTNGRGQSFIDEYRAIYNMRVAAKRSGDKKTSDALKISLNGTFGKLGSIYSAFYSPHLLLGVTLTGQLNLLCLIAELIKIKGVKVFSANTDGIMVGYPKAARDKVLKAIAKNAKHTKFEYEETQYARIAMKDVNNYVAITTDSKVKAKGLYASTGLMKNPTMPVCSNAIKEFLLNGAPIEQSITSTTTVSDFTTIRNVTGGCEQEGRQLGRVARWYMTTEAMGAIRYTTNGNLVPKTEGARECLLLPEKLPKDLNYQWYVDEANAMLDSMGVTHHRNS